MARLTFADLHRPGSSSSGRFGGSQTQRDSLDFVVDGSSLYVATNARHYDFIGLLGWSRHEHDLESVQRLLLDRPTILAGDRQSLFVCAECGDIGCGAITANIAKTGNRYRWRDFAYENDYDQSMTNREVFRDIGPFEFDADPYRATLLEVLGRR